ncbi:DEAD/DEAH box helicase [Aspergillus pseudoustus]|uniref:DEAD/DEAH box helicase n=1 Tax=Aspergillus pseudoustus TaxID=1810923 RepID=A0ABR4JV38_9EURO
MAETAQLLEWFERLHSRTLDLIGDYAGDELFLIEGDSLLLQCFSDSALDFSNGLPILHVTSLVEKFLANLHQRNCVFHIVFFADNAQACIPAHTSSESWPKYHLAREAILQHLVQNLSTAVSAIRIMCFEDYWSEEFEEYLRSTGAYFLMCHDGTAPVGAQGCTAESSQTWSAKIIMRSMIHWFICHGYNISILNSLECRDTKVMSMILEGSVSRARKLDGTPSLYSGTLVKSGLEDSKRTPDCHIPNPNIRCREDKCNCVVAEPIIDQVLQLARSRDLELTQRDWATIMAIGTMAQCSVLGDEHSTNLRAMLLHAAILADCKISGRAVSNQQCRSGEIFLQDFASNLCHILRSKSWKQIVVKTSCRCDLADVVDGRLFLGTLRALQTSDYVHDSFSFSTLQRFETLSIALFRLFHIDIRLSTTLDLACQTPSRSAVVTSVEQMGVRQANSNGQGDISVLPFHNAVIAAHLEPVSVVAKVTSRDIPSDNMSRIFQELSHWHNHRRPLDNRRKPELTERERISINRRNQRFMTDTARYAASLTNAVGGFLSPEAIFVRDPKAKPLKQLHGPSTRETTSTRGGTKEDNLSQQKNSKGGKFSIRDQIAAQQKSKQDELQNKHLATWRTNIESFEMIPGYVARYITVKDYLASLPADKRGVVQAEVLAYMVSTLVNAWNDRYSSLKYETLVHIVSLIWHTILKIASLKTGVTEDIAKVVQRTVKAINLPQIDLQPHESREISFRFGKFVTTNGHTGVSLSPTEFQLLDAGPYLDRSMGSMPDSRVHDFEPDKWQREVLDQIDARRSLFVVAPTSAGKTFISFYAMKQILEDDNDGVLVYVAPTKALVNQIAAEVQARFSKTYSTPGKSVWAIHTRDYRINNATGCQVLITVPHILQIMLLAPSNAKTWSPRVKRIIFDEVHCIGQAEDGLIWEQLLLLAPCPIIALSATIGNPSKFREWLEITQKSNALKLKMIEHKARYSDLRKYIYHPPAKFAFNGLPSAPQLAPLGLDASPSMAFLHPVASLIDRSRGMPDDLTLEPRDCLTLWKCMTKHATSEFPVNETLHPEIALPAIIKKADVIGWESQLKELLRHWMKESSSPFEDVVKELSESVSDHKRPVVQVSSGELDNTVEPQRVPQDSILETTLPLICSLHEQDALPALFFNYDRGKCEKICDHLLTELEKSEKRWKASNPSWKKNLAKFEEWKKAQEKQKQSRVREPKKQKGKKKRGDDDDDDGNEEGGRFSKTEQARLVASKDSSTFESFDPDAPVTGFHFANEKKLTDSEFQDYATQLRHRDVPDRMIAALKRGIGVHHSGMNRKYRQVCEILFRKGYLRVVIATGTLALGINMPCKSVVFSGDSVFLTALGFRQAAGRAGRRGFDFLGNVVFQNIPHGKVCRLLSSKLPDLNGHFPLTTSLVLRLLTLLHESKSAPYAVKAINSILSCPRIYLGGEESKHTVLHHLRFSIEYLRRNWLLNENGAPLNFAGTVSHLYYTGNSGFAFHALLSEGYFHGLCRNILSDPIETKQTLMLVLSHLFGRYNLRPSILESWQSRDKSTSVVVLPPLPKGAARILESHNQKTLGIYSAYVTTFINQHIMEEDCTLPLTGIRFGGSESATDVSSSLEFLPPTRVTSSFAALSGHRDKWNSINELCTRVRGGVWLEQSVIPHLQVSPDKEGPAPLNAYLYDFYKHSNIHALATENMIRSGDLWYLLNDFSLVLATIVTSLENFMKLSPGCDPDLLNANGAGDIWEDDSDGAERGEGDAPSKSVDLPLPSQTGANTTVTVPKKPKQSEVADNWDDDVSESSDGGSSTSGERDNDTGGVHQSPTVEYATNGSDAFLEDEGLMHVLRAFRTLREEFNEKFRAIWA